MKNIYDIELKPGEFFPIVCKEQHDTPSPTAGGSTLDKCQYCGFAIWVAASTRKVYAHAKAKLADVRYVCMTCAHYTGLIDSIVNDNGVEMATCQEQVSDVEQYLEQRQQAARKTKAEAMKNILHNSKGIPIVAGVEYIDKETESVGYMVGMAPDGIGGNGRTYVEIQFSESTGTYYADINNLRATGNIKKGAVDPEMVSATLTEAFEGFMPDVARTVAMALMSFHHEPKPETAGMLMELIGNCYWMAAGHVMGICARSHLQEDPRMFANVMEEISNFGHRAMADDPVYPTATYQKWIDDAMAKGEKDVADGLMQKIQEMFGDKSKPTPPEAQGR
jgi:hypothetical protein